MRVTIRRLKFHAALCVVRNLPSILRLAYLQFLVPTLEAYRRNPRIKW